MKKLITACLILAGQSAFTQTMDPENYLLKVSERLTGKPPTPAEYKALNE